MCLDYKEFLMLPPINLAVLVCLFYDESRFFLPKVCFLGWGGLFWELLLFAKSMNWIFIFWILFVGPCYWIMFPRFKNFCVKGGGSSLFDGGIWPWEIECIWFDWENPWTLTVFPELSPSMSPEEFDKDLIIPWDLLSPLPYWPEF